MSLTVRLFQSARRKAPPVELVAAVLRNSVATFCIYIAAAKMARLDFNFHYYMIRYRSMQGV